MLIDIVESMMKGETIFPRAFVVAQVFWTGFFAEHGDDGDTALQKAIEDAQMSFQWKLEEDTGLSAPFAKSIMALTAVAALYRDGFDDKDFVRRVIRCFVESKTMSGGVMSAADQVRKMYYLE